VKKLGLKGVQINSNINGKNLDEAEFVPFFEAAQQLDIPVFVHPHYVAGAERLRKHYLINLIGNPVDTTIAIASLVFGGVLERFPKLKFVFAHAGGCAPYIRGRWDHGYRNVYGTQYAIPKPPGEYLKKTYFDTITHWAPALSYLINTHGVDHLVMGSDYPFDMADPDPVKTVSNQSLSKKDQEKIMGENAAQLLKL
jgi:aminocarboxymuconate-semialdehyde decarboxylase